MKTTFKQYLNERIYVDTTSKQIKITYPTFKDSEIDKEHEIDNYLKSGLYKAKDVKDKSVRIFSLYLFDTNPVTVEIVKSLKGKGDYFIDEKTYVAFLKKSATRIREFIKASGYDTIIYPRSSSPLVDNLVSELRAQINTNSITFLTDTFLKKKIKDVSDAADKVTAIDVTELFDFDNPAFDKLSADSLISLEKNLVKIINDNIKAGEGATVSLKRIFKRDAKLITNFLELAPDVTSFKGKNVLIIDDVLASGTTFSEMIKLVKQTEPNNISGLTLFKTN